VLKNDRGGAVKIGIRHDDKHFVISTAVVNNQQEAAREVSNLEGRFPKASGLADGFHDEPAWQRLRELY
jgi:hypothetical protein